MLRATLRFKATAAALCAALTIAASSAASADSRFTFTGDFDSVSNDAYAFDGADTTNLPGLFDGLRGGSFRATYTVPTLIAPTNPAFNFASYTFGAPYGLTYTLYDATGAAVMTGAGDPRYNRAFVYNNAPTTDINNTLLGYFDGVELTGYAGQLSGLQTPAPLYGTPDVFTGSAALRFTHFTDLPDIPADVSDLNLPLDTAAYLGFPGKRFSVGAFWGSGDYNDQSNAFQYIDSTVFFAVRGVSITAVVPEPGSPALLLGLGGSGAALILRRRRHRR